MTVGSCEFESHSLHFIKAEFVQNEANCGNSSVGRA